MLGFLAISLSGFPFAGRQTPAPIDFDVKSGSGLTVKVGGIPVVRGTWFQLYEPDWSRGYYTSQYGEQEIKKLPDGTFQLTWRTKDGRGSGSQTFRQEGDRLVVNYTFLWTGEKPIQAEVTAGMVWAPAVQSGTLVADGKPTRSLTATTYGSQALAVRRFAPESSSYAFRSPAVEVGITSSRPLVLFDARGYQQGWAEKAPLFWLGADGVDLKPNEPVSFRVEWNLRGTPRAAQPGTNRSVATIPLPDVQSPDTSLPPLIPMPQRNYLNWNKPIELTGAYHFPIGTFDYFPDFKRSLAQRFILPPVTPKTRRVNFDGGVSKLGLVPGGYRIKIDEKGVSVVGEELEGLQNGLLRLAQLAFTKDGKLWLPGGALIDQPASTFRGVHLFVGPRATEFHKELWSRVLRPLGYNRVVLQCERTQWNATPGIETSISMKREALAGLFAMYRGLGVEPIPLIQSWGHMEWLFANSKNLDLVWNPVDPYAIDPRKPEAQAKLKAIWAEATALLKPKYLHFGLDEVDMRGYLGTPSELTTLWEQHLPFLGTIAKENNAKMMLWGDKALGPGEAPDATHGATLADAKARRAAIPKGAYITDWHYKPDPNPLPFAKPLELWREEGFVPIASPWYRPENTRGFGLAAFATRTGFLQTTWCGYESWEGGMLDALEQFSAMILTADYGWSGRQDTLAELPYKPAEIFRKMYFDAPSPLKPLPGEALAFGEGDLQIGPYRFRTGTPVQLESRLTEEGAANPQGVVLPGSKAPVSAVILAAVSAVPGDEGETIANVELRLASGAIKAFPIRYGLDVRAGDDAKPTNRAIRAGRISAIRLDLTPGSIVKAVVIRAANPVSGLRVEGVSFLASPPPAKRK